MVENWIESLSVTIMTWTLGVPGASFGSMTVISTDSSHSYTSVRSTAMVAHCPPAGSPGAPKRLQAGAWPRADSSTGWNSSHSKTTSSTPKP